MKRQTYLAPDVKIVEVNATDVICTSEFILDSVNLFAGASSWQKTWMEKLEELEDLK